MRRKCSVGHLVRVIIQHYRYMEWSKGLAAIAGIFLTCLEKLFYSLRSKDLPALCWYVGHLIRAVSLPFNMEQAFSHCFGYII